MVLADLAFEVEKYESAIRITACINGRRLPDMVEEFETAHGLDDPAGGYNGLVPAFYSLASVRDHFLGRSPNIAGRTYVLGCECGDIECWPLIADVEASDSTVLWKRFGQPHRPNRDYSEFGPFLFDRNRYDNALARIEHAWQPAI
jgi:hypothetical protein